MIEFFRLFSKKISIILGSFYVFLFAVFIIIIWFLSGFIFNFSDTWQLVINTGTTISTFLMVFIIQNTQNRDSITIQLKLDELIRSQRKARNDMIDLDVLTDTQLKELQEESNKIYLKTKNKIVNSLPN